MRTIYHLFCFTCLSLPALTQSSFGIMGISITPEQPSTQDSITAQVQLRFSTLQNLVAVQDTLIDQTIYLDLSYCGGFLTAVDVREDQFNIGQLAAGDYKLICQVSELGPRWNEDGMMTDTCVLDTLYQDSMLFKVALLSQDEEPFLSDIAIWPNPTTGYIYLNGISGLSSLQLRTTSGKKLYSWESPIPSNEQLTLPQLPVGLYLLELNFINSLPIWKRLIIANPH